MWSWAPPSKNSICWCTAKFSANMACRDKPFSPCRFLSVSMASAKCPKASAITSASLKPPAKNLAALLVDLKLAPSKAEGERLIKQGGVEIDEARIDDPRRDIDLSQPLEFLLRAGKKKFLRIVIE